MAQWINVFRNNSFVNPMRLPLLCRNSRAVALCCWRCENQGSHSFPYRSLPLSTTVLNDTGNTRLLNSDQWYK